MWRCRMKPELVGPNYQSSFILGAERQDRGNGYQTDSIYFINFSKIKNHLEIGKESTPQGLAPDGGGKTKID